MNDCVCGHKKIHHIYEEGACRTGVPCSCKCFTPVLTEEEVPLFTKSEVEKIEDAAVTIYHAVTKLIKNWDKV